MRFSEEQLAALTLERLGKPAARILIGGYGMGFTLRAARARLGPKAQRSRRDRARNPRLGARADGGR